MNYKYFLLIAIISIISSCSSKQHLLKKNFETKRISMNGIIEKIDIIDNREGVSSKKLKIPTISFPGQSDIVSPTLTEPQKDSIQKQIKSYFDNNKNSIDIVVKILVGKQEFSASTFHEREYVQFDTKIDLINSSNKSKFKNCSSTAYFEAKSIDASNHFIDQIYNKAIRTSIYKCFEKLSE